LVAADLLGDVSVQVLVEIVNSGEWPLTVGTGV
jgi:hypothetical protein